MTVRRAFPIRRLERTGHHEIARRASPTDDAPTSHRFSHDFRQVRLSSAEPPVPSQAEMEEAQQVESDIDAMRGGGAPLDPATRAFMEPRFGHDFSQVRVHTDARAATVAQSLDALAFTVGDDIAFAPGQYRPGSDEGRTLLAHELTHTLQQRGGVARVQRQDAGKIIRAMVIRCNRLCR
jgi:hypothetical protein